MKKRIFSTFVKVEWSESSETLTTVFSICDLMGGHVSRVPPTREPCLAEKKKSQTNAFRRVEKGFYTLCKAFFN